MSPGSSNQSWLAPSRSVPRNVTSAVSPARTPVRDKLLSRACGNCARPAGAENATANADTATIASQRARAEFSNLSSFGITDRRPKRLSRPASAPRTGSALPGAGCGPRTARRFGTASNRFLASGARCPKYAPLRELEVGSELPDRRHAEPAYPSSGILKGTKRSLHACLDPSIDQARTRRVARRSTPPVAPYSGPVEAR